MVLWYNLPKKGGGIMPNLITDVKKIVKIEDIDKANEMLATGNWILVDTQHYVPNFEVSVEYVVQYILGQIK